LAIDELNTSEYDGKTIGMNFPVIASYWNENNGYNIKGNHKAIPLDVQETEYILLSHPGNMSDTSKYQNDYHLKKEFKVGYAFIRLYIKN
jgi:hypothetical protein